MDIIVAKWCMIINLKNQISMMKALVAKLKIKNLPYFCNQLFKYYTITIFLHVCYTFIFDNRLNYIKNTEFGSFHLCFTLACAINSISNVIDGTRQL